jgi:hypothetical protein
MHSNFGILSDTRFAVANGSCNVERYGMTSILLVLDMPDGKHYTK